MAAYILASDGNATGNIWGTVDATSLLNSEAANTLLTTAYVESAAFTPGAIVVDGIAVKIAARALSPSGTISARIAQAGSTVAGTEVTINVSDIAYGQGLSPVSVHNGWVFFKFAASVTLLGATAYTVSAKTSATSQVHLYRNATAGNWSRMLRTTTLSTPGAGDTFHVLGERTAAATVTARTVTWNGTAATDFGDASLTLASVTVGQGGTLTYAATAATNFLMRVSGVFDVCAGGVLNMGTTGVPCPRTSTMVLEFDSAADGDFGLRVYGTFNGQGLSRLDGVNNHYVLLAEDEPAASTTLVTDGQLSARNGDIIAIASTTRTAADAETVTLGADAGVASLTCGATANAHGGTTPVQAEVVCLNRDVIVRAVTSTLMGYVFFADTGTVDADWVWFRYMGHASTATKRGVEISTETGAVNLHKCSFSDFDNRGVFATNSANVLNNVSLTDNVFSKVGHQATGHAAITINEATSGTYTITGNVIISDNTGQGSGIDLGDFGGVCSNNRISSGGGEGLVLSTTEEFITGTIDGNVIHSMTLRGLVFSIAVWGGKISNTTIWRTAGTSGVRSTFMLTDLVIDGMTLFGCANASIEFTNTPGPIANCVLKNVVSNGDTTFATTNGISFSATQLVNLRLEDCNFSTASGIKTAHTNDFNSTAASGNYAQIVTVDTILAAATEFANSANLHGRSFIAHQRRDGVSGTHLKQWFNLGTVSLDTATFRTASPSEKLEPTAATAAIKLLSGVKRVPLASGQTCTISAYVNKGGTYNGAAPRLRVRHNPAAGISEATVATHAAASGSFSQLTGAVGPVSEDCVLEFEVDVDGTAGQVNVDDWSAAVA